MKDKLLKGIVPPIVTPVDSNENVNTKGLREVIKYVMSGGVHGIFVNGSNGEFYGLDFENQKLSVETAIDEVDGKIPVYAGASSISTKECIALAKMAESAGADALTVLTPMYINPSEQELFDHFKSIAYSSKLPIVLYNNPGKTNNNISQSLLRKLLKIDNILGVKNTSMDFSLTIKYINESEIKPEFSVFGGIDYYIYATLCHGGVGSVAGTANVAPALVVKIYESFLKGDLTASLEAQKALTPLRDAYGLGTFPVMMKVMLNILGVDAGLPIKPVSYVNDETVEQAKKILIDMNLLN